jgi:hypothetical protein
VTGADFNLSSRPANIDYNSGHESPPELIFEIESAGYPIILSPKEQTFYFILAHDQLPAQLKQHFILAVCFGNRRVMAADLCFLSAAPPIRICFTVSSNQMFKLCSG